MFPIGNVAIADVSNLFLTSIPTPKFEIHSYSKIITFITFMSSLRKLFTFYMSMYIT